MKAKDLKPNPKNPRDITGEKLEALKRTIAKFGDLSGIVYNRQTENLVGGHQRVKSFPDSEVKIEKKYTKPTKTGTVAEGYVVINGERFNYREVDWDEITEKAANIAANKGAGEWNLELLSEWMRDLDSFGFDLDLTLFDSNELGDLLVPTVNPNFQPGSEGEQGKLDEKKRVECPECGHRFTPGWS